MHCALCYATVLCLNTCANNKSRSRSGYSSIGLFNHVVKEEIFHSIKSYCSLCVILANANHEILKRKQFGAYSINEKRITKTFEESSHTAVLEIFNVIKRLHCSKSTGTRLSAD